MVGCSNIDRERMEELGTLLESLQSQSQQLERPLLHWLSHLLLPLNHKQGQNQPEPETSKKNREAAEASPKPNVAVAACLEMN